MLSGLLSRFAAESGPVVHIAPTEIFTVHGIAVTNSMIFTWICSIIFIIILTFVSRRATIRPKGGFTQIVEVGTDFVTDTLENSLGNKRLALKYAPFFVTVFFFIAFSNLFGLLPGIGEALTYHGTPVFRAATADLNATLAIATISMFMIQYYAIKESGFIKHLRHYFSGKLWNPLTYLPVTSAKYCILIYLLTFIYHCLRSVALNRQSRSTILAIFLLILFAVFNGQ